MFSYQPEILDYLKGVADKYGLRRNIRFNSFVDRAHWDDSEYRWHVFTVSGQEYVAQFLISGAGALHIPSLPDIAGIGDFDGPVFHTAQWDHSVDLSGKRVAVIGTGASAIQVLPELVKIADQVQLYQRTAAWIKPRINFTFPRVARQAFATIPGVRAALRAATYWTLDSRAIALAKRPELMTVAGWMYKANMRRYVKDPALRAKLTPRYRPGCKRILISDNFYQAVADPITELITDGIARVTRGGIVTADGTERAVDAIVLATGFHVTDSFNYLDLKGAHGEDLVDRWRREGIAAHRGITVADVPNLFFLLGPNTGLGHNSVVFMIESQIRYITARSPRRTSTMHRRWPRPGPHRTNTTTSCSTTCPPRSGTPAVAAVGTSTTTASTGPCGRVLPPSTGWRRAGSSRPSTGSPASVPRSRHWQSSTKATEPDTPDTTTCVARDVAPQW